MSKLTIAVRSAGITLALLLASIGASSCGAEDTEQPDPGQPTEIAPGTGPSALNPRDCAAVARGGKVDICHVSDADDIPVSALTVPVEACGSVHAEHEDDFFAAGASGCKQEKTCKGGGKKCKTGNDCCSGFCGGTGKKPVCL